MKKGLRHIICPALTSLLLLAQGCIFEKEEVLPVPGELNTVGYLSLRLEAADSTPTRAVGDSFSYGKRDEFALAPGNHHYAVFYNDPTKAPIAIATLSDMVENEGSNKSANSTVAFATIAAQSEQPDMFENLKECLVLLNADVDANQLWSQSKASLLQTVVTSPFCKGSDGKEYFTMSNAVYVDGGQMVVSSKIDPSKVYTSYLEAIEMAWKGEAAVEVAVERLAAKVTLGFANSAYNDAATKKIFTPAENGILLFTHLSEGEIPHYSGDFSYQIQITGWGMNALEQKAYLFRNFKTAGNYFDGWYNTANQRVYWSEDCNYRPAVYPWQYRKAIDDPSVPYYADQTNILRNLSFEELSTNQFRQDCIYLPENTYDFTDGSFDRTLDGRTELLAGSHVIVCADLLTNIDDRNTYKAVDLYRDRNGNFYRSERDCFLALVTAMNNNLLSHSFLKYTYYDWEKGGGGQTLYAKTNGEYTLYYNGMKLTPENIGRVAGSLTIDASVQGGDGQRLIWMDGFSIQDDAGNQLQIYSNIDEVNPKDPNTNVRLREATVSDLKSLLLQYIGVIDHYKDGKMYYAVPVGYLKDAANSSAGEDSYAIYGVVRNCVYDIQIQDVTGLGTSVDNIAEPIVPNKVTTHDHLFISISILRWHEVDQNVPGVIS